MDNNNRPRSREKYVTNNSKGVAKRGNGLSGSSNSNSSTSHSSSPVSLGALGGGKKKVSGLAVVIIIIFMLVKGAAGGALSGSNNGSQGQSNSSNDLVQYDNDNPAPSQNSAQNNGLDFQSNYLGDVVSNNYPDATSNTGVLDTNIASDCRAKYTTIKGNGNDQVTIMVYMCGTDLESKHGMATKDLKEMTSATLSNKVNIIVYTGGCKSWNNSIISSKTNQIWRIANGGMECLVQDDGNKSMTDPATLTNFIKWCTSNYPANRNELIMWDHGGGAITGYGHDEKPGHSGSMTLALIDKALANSGTKFDFIGFDACLMATLEAGLTMEPYSDYYIASEETEPGVGWYYTRWLTALSSNPSMPTIEIGKQIIDDYVTECNRSCNGQKTCLSIVDLAELKSKAPSNLNSFAASMNTMLANNEYKAVSDARYKTKEFAQSSSIDHVDLVDLSRNMGTNAGDQLADAILSCVKYNRTSSNMKNAYGVSIYFPYRKVNRVDNAVSAYKELGMDSEYTKCIRSFAQVEVNGQSSSSGTSNPLNALLGNGSSNGSNTLDMVFDFLTNRDMPEDQVNDYVSKNRFDSSNLVWKEVNGHKVISLSESQWELVHDITINMFYDDGTGYIDLGLDNLFEFDDAGNMIGDTDPTWIAIDGQPVAYYYIDTVEEKDRYSIMGRVPALLNGQNVNLILIFDTEHPQGYIAGARTDYVAGETDTIAKSLIQLSQGDKLDFICNYYDYNGNLKDSYFLGEQMTLSSLPVISNVPIDGTTKITYRFTDIYNQTYWTPVLQ